MSFKCCLCSEGFSVLLFSLYRVMQNFTVSKANSTITSEGCDPCLETSIFRLAILPYVLISVPANSCVLKLMVSSPGFWTNRMGMSEFHMVLSELLFGFVGVPLLVLSLNMKAPLTYIVVKVICIIFMARVQFQSTVCLERFVAVVHPVLYLRYKAFRYRMGFCCFIWLQTFLIGAVQLVFCREVNIDMNTTYFVSVFCINSSCSFAILRVLKKPSPGERGKDRSSLAKRRAFNLVLFFQAIAVVGYLPLISVFYLSRIYSMDSLCVWEAITYSFMIWVGGTYPFIYLHKAWKEKKN